MTNIYISHAWPTFYPANIEYFLYFPCLDTGHSVDTAPRGSMMKSPQRTRLIQSQRDYICERQVYASFMKITFRKEICKTYTTKELSMFYSMYYGNQLKLFFMNQFSYIKLVVFQILYLPMVGI